jgi:hypothetical protein
MLRWLVFCAALTSIVYFTTICALDWLERGLTAHLRPLPRATRVVVAVFEARLYPPARRALQPLCADEYFWVSKAEARAFCAKGALFGAQLALLLSKLGDGDSALVLSGDTALVQSPAALVAAVQLSAASLVLARPRSLAVFAVRKTAFALGFAANLIKYGALDTTLDVLLHGATAGDHHHHKPRAGFCRLRPDSHHVLVLSEPARLVEPRATPGREFVADLLQSLVSAT